VEQLLEFEEGWGNLISDLKKHGVKVYKTIGGRKDFTIQYKNGRVEFKDPYTGCVISRSEIRKVYDRFIEVKSWKTYYCTDVTVHASYFLRLLKAYFAPNLYISKENAE
jgi:hypothetical protein